VTGELGPCSKPENAYEKGLHVSERPFDAHYRCELSVSHGNPLPAERGRTEAQGLGMTRLIRTPACPFLDAPWYQILLVAPLHHASEHEVQRVARGTD